MKADRGSKALLFLPLFFPCHSWLRADSCSYFAADCTNVKGYGVTWKTWRRRPLPRKWVANMSRWVKVSRLFAISYYKCNTTAMVKSTPMWSNGASIVIILVVGCTSIFWAISSLRCWPGSNNSVLTSLAYLTPRKGWNGILFCLFCLTHKLSSLSYRRKWSRMLGRWACIQTYLLFRIQNLSWSTTTAKCILTLRCWRVEATVLDQIRVSFFLAVYVWCYLKRDQAMQVSAGTGGIFDFISTIYFYVDTIRDFQFQLNKTSSSAFYI